MPIGHMAPDFSAPRVGIEPTTNRLTVDCSTAELPGNIRNTRGPLRHSSQKGAKMQRRYVYQGKSHCRCQEGVFFACQQGCMPDLGAGAGGAELGECPGARACGRAFRGASRQGADSLRTPQSEQDSVS